MRANVNDNENVRILYLINNDPVLRAVLNAPYSSVDSYIDSNLNTMADARTLMKRLVKVVMYLLRAKFNEMPEE